MSTALTWFPPSTVPGISSVVFGEDAPYKLRDINGFAALPGEPVTNRGPYQPGVTLLDNAISGKRLTITITVVATSREEYWQRRDELAHAFSVVPRFDLRVPEQGTLRLSREGQDDIQIDCTPVSAPMFTGRSPWMVTAEIELFAPSPWWRTVSDIASFFENLGGVEIIEAGNTGEGLAITAAGETDEGLAITLGRGEIEIDNDGHSPAPFTVEIDGEIDTPRLTLQETGESLEISGVISAGETIRIATEFGKKEVTLIDSSGNESNAFGQINTARADFFWLQRGGNTLQFTHASNTSGSARLTWRKRYAGA